MYLKRMGIEATFVNLVDIAEAEKAFKPNTAVYDLNLPNKNILIVIIIRSIRHI